MAVKWYTIAAERDKGDAQYRLGEMYERGEGVKKDIDKAIMWYEKAADNHDQLAKRKLLFLKQSKHKD